MSRMFGDRINEFVLSVDIMNEETFIDLVEIAAKRITTLVADAKTRDD